MKVINQFDRSIGIGTVKNIDRASLRLTISFSPDVERIYTPEGVRGINRIVIRPVDKCLFNHNGSSIKGRVTGLVTDNPGELRIYNFEGENGEKLQVKEDQFEVLTGVYSDDPVANLSNLRFGCGKWFDVRTNLLYAIETLHNKSKGIFSLIGARLYPYPHQAFVVGKVLRDSKHRFMLADEVGLGKTIEAGLITQNLIYTRNVRRILIVAPDSLAHQWLCEMYIKFGKKVFIFMTESRYADLGLKWIKKDQVICSIEFLKNHQHEWDYIVKNSKWDMLIIDEAHQIKPQNPLGDFLRRLSKKTENVLVLSATPIMGHEKQYLNVLSLFDPHLYERMSLKSFRERLKLQEDLSDMLIATEDADPDEWLKKEWLKLLPRDTQVKKLCAAFGKDTDAPTQLCRYIENYYKINRRIIRNRRQAGHIRLPPRDVDICVYQPSPVERALHTEMDILFKLYADKDSPRLPRLILALGQAAVSSPFALVRLLKWGVNHTKDDGDLNEQVSRCLNRAQGFCDVWESDNNAKLVWLTSFIDKHTKAGEKFVLFADFPETIRSLVHFLKKRFGGEAVAEFHRNLKSNTRDAEALKFIKDKSCILLVCDELGGEGRNFQFAKGIIHYDLPWELFKVEQRIGRLDRLGRDEVVTSYVPVANGWIDAAVTAIYKDAVKIFSQSASGLEFIFEEIVSIIVETIVLNGTEGLYNALEKIKKIVSEEREQKAADLILDRSSYSPEDDPEYSEIAEITDADRLLAKHVCRWAKAIGSSIKRNSAGSGSVSFRIQHTKIPLYGVYEDHTYVGTFFRNIATEREDLNFFSLGHELVNALVESARSELSATSTMLHRHSSEYRWKGFRILVSAHIDYEKLRQVKNGNRFLYECEFIFPRKPFELYVKMGDEGFVVEENEKFLEFLLSKPEPNELRMFSDDEFDEWDMELWGKQCNAAMECAFEHINRQLRPQWEDLIDQESRKIKDDLFLLETAVKAAGDKALGMSQREVAQEKKAKQDVIKALQSPCIEVLAMAYYAIGPPEDRQGTQSTDG